MTRSRLRGPSPSSPQDDKLASASLALILHAHLPFVRHPEHEEFLEEDWLFEAITETYHPALRPDASGWSTRTSVPADDAHHPTALRDAAGRIAPGALYLRHLERTIGLAEREIERNREHGTQLAEVVALLSFELFMAARRLFREELGSAICSGRFANCATPDCLEIMAAAATHALLPLLGKTLRKLGARRSASGATSYREDVRSPNPLGSGCRNAPTRGLEKILQEANLRWFILDAHGLMFAPAAPA